MTQGIFIVGNLSIDKLDLSCLNFFNFSDFFHENFDKFKVFSQNTNRFVHESVFIIFHEQMNIHEQMNMNNEQYIHANRMNIHMKG